MTAKMGILKMLWAVLSSSVKDGTLSWWPCTGHSLHCVFPFPFPFAFPVPFLSFPPFKCNSSLL